MPIIITVAIADDNKSFLLAKPDIIDIANCISNIECIIARTSGTPKNISNLNRYILYTAYFEIYFQVLLHSIFLFLFII